MTSVLTLSPNLMHRPWAGAPAESICVWAVMELLSITGKLPPYFFCRVESLLGGKRRDRLDLHQLVRRHEPRDLEHRRGGIRRREEPRPRLGDLVEALHVADEDGQLDDVGHRPARLLDDLLDRLQDARRLRPHIPRSKRLAPRGLRRNPADEQQPVARSHLNRVRERGAQPQRLDVQAAERHGISRVIIEPVMEAASESRNMSAPTGSSGRSRREVSTPGLAARNCGVSMIPGRHRLTRIRKGATSRASVLAKAATAPLEVVYGADPALPISAVPEENITIAPERCSAITGRTARLAHTTPLRLIDSTRCHSPGSSSATSPIGCTIAAQTKPSMRPWRSRTAATARVTSSSRETSTCSNSIVPGLWSSAASACPASS